ncbi:heme-dependent oxidative N-demethylase family protein [Mesorhizobium sp. IMUNJ 23232]|uniref:heme-dependent oxidative N-demethylase family protein n=1 Tax=Mesorhizobium sp. IMUNJ 23232 TaxID=3376064 RepID=UPI0037B60B6D
MLPTHTPYDGSSKLFTIGLKPLDLADWIEVDDRYEAYVAEKQWLYATIPEKVFVEEADTHAAQVEVLDRLAEHLTAHASRLFATPEQKALFDANLAAARDRSDAPLRAASLLIQEDLILMRRGEDGWRLAAGSLCFPSSWSLLEKFRHPLHEIHMPVPAFGPGSRMAELIYRMFDNLQGQGVQRFNWSIQANADLYHPLSNVARIDRATNRPSKFPDLEAAARAFIRVERQTLRKLPASGDILFTIRIHLDPLSVLRGHPDRAALAKSFAEQITALDEAQLDYKGLTADRGRLVRILEEMAAEPSNLQDSALL